MIALLIAIPGIATAQVSSVPAVDNPAAARSTRIDAARPPAPAPATPPAGSVSGMGDINLYPKRVVIDDRNRTSSIGVYNKTANTGDYEITIGDMVMTPDGRLVEPGSLPEADPTRARLKGAAELVRWSPHRFTLPGNEAQMVRIMARVSADLPPGEYRTHFSAIAVPPGDDGLTIDEATNGRAPSGGIGVRITPRFGISIPVIIRVGETTLTAGIRDLAVIAAPDGTRLIRLTVTRSGNRSAFGDITVTAAGAAKPVAMVKGVGVYTEIDQRTITLPIDPALDPRLVGSGAKLTATYVDDDFEPGKTLARQDFTVP